MKGALKPDAAAEMIPEGASLMIGGFMAVGPPERMVDAIVARGVGGLTQAALAAAVGISQSYLAGLEAGSRKGDPALFLRLARALSVRMEDIVSDDGAREP